jgi:hypothetical protein
MRMKIINVSRTVGRWVQAFLEVRLPIDITTGLRTR